MTPTQIEALAKKVAQIVLASLHSGTEIKISPERYITIAEAAQVMGVSQPTIERLTRSGAIPSHKIGRCRRYLASELRPVTSPASPESADQDLANL